MIIPQLVDDLERVRGVNPAKAGQGSSEMLSN